MEKFFILLLSFLGGFIIFKVFHNDLLLALMLGLFVPIITTIYLFGRSSSIDIESNDTKIVSIPKFKLIFIELAVLAFIGYIFYKYSYGTASYYANTYPNHPGFILFLPLFGAIMHFLYSNSFIKARFLIIIISIIGSLSIHILNLVLHPLADQQAQQTYGMLYGFILIFGTPVAVIFGIMYAIYFIKFFFKSAFNNKTNSVEK